MAIAGFSKSEIEITREKDHVMIEGKKEELTNRIAKALEDEAKGDFELAKNAAIEGINDVEKLLINHTEAV
jgi:HSP20 family molecular chaperone IbpA